MAKRKNGFIEHPGVIVRRMFESVGLRPGEVAEALGVSRMQLHRVTSGEAALSTEMAVRLSEVIPGSASPREWLRMQADYDLDQLDLPAIKKQTKKLRRAA